MSASPIPGLEIPAGLEHLLPAFLAEIDRDLRRLAEIGASGGAALTEHAHAMHGKCAMFGAHGLAVLLGRLEDVSSSGAPDEIAPVVATVIERGSALGLYLSRGT